MPSEAHNLLSHLALTWLANKCTMRGTKSCVDVILGEGYVADAAAICGLQYQWVNKFTHMPPLTEDFTFIFESKVSRSDFQKTFKRNDHKGNRLIARANFHFVVTTKKVTDVKEIPEPWGWLETSGTGLSIKKLPTYCEWSESHLHEFAYRLLRSNNSWKQYNVEKFNGFDLERIVDTINGQK